MLIKSGFETVLKLGTVTEEEYANTDPKRAQNSFT